ncbi:MAG: hypothetical protein RR188_04050 [Eubacterium sp.]
MKSQFIPFILTLATDIPVYMFIFCLIDFIFERRIAQKYILLYLIVTALVHTVMSLNYTLAFFRAYFIIGVLMFLPVIFYKGENITKRMGCGILLCIFLLFMDVLTLILYLALSDVDVMMTFSVERQIYYLGISAVLYPLFFRGVKKIMQRLIQKSLLFFYQNFLLVILIFFELGAINYIFAIDSEISVSYVFEIDQVMRACILLLACVILDGLIIYALNRLDKSYKIEYEIKLNQQKTEMQQCYYNLAEEHYRQSRELMHDLKNHLLTLEHLYETGENEEASHYVGDALKNMDVILLEKNENLKKNVRTDGKRKWN